MKEIRHCKCGGEAIRAIGGPDSNNVVHWVVCKACGKTGKRKANKRKAIAAWNKEQK